MTLDSYTAKNAGETELLAYIKDHDQFTLPALKTHASVSDWKTENFLRMLCREGYVFLVSTGNGGRNIYSRHSQPNLKTKKEDRRKSTHGGMWAVMRTMREFSAAEIFAATCDAFPDLTADKANRYCRNLLKAKYLKVTQTAHHQGRPARYRLIKNTGPLPPEVRRLECVVDGNTDLVAYVAGDRK